MPDTTSQTATMTVPSHPRILVADKSSARELAVETHHFYIIAFRGLEVRLRAGQHPEDGAGAKSLGNKALTYTGAKEARKYTGGAAIKAMHLDDALKQHGCPKHGRVRYYLWREMNRLASE